MNEFRPENNHIMQKTEMIILIFGLLLLGLLLYIINSIVSPFLVIFIIEFLLFPLRKSRYIKNLMWLTFIIFLFWMLSELSQILFPFLLSFIFAYLLNPLVSYLETKNIKRWLSSLMTILILLLLFSLIIILIIPPALSQLNNLMFTITDITKDLVDRIKDGSVFIWLEGYGIPVDMSRELLTQQLTPRLESVLKNFLNAFLNFISGISNIISQIINLLIIPFITFYLLKDFTNLKGLVKSAIPARYEAISRNYYLKVDNLMGRYLRGAILVAFIHGTLVGVFLWIFGINYPLVLGLIAGVLSIIPYIGLIISLSLSLLIALFSPDPVWLRIVFVLITFGVLQIFEASVISPNILGKQVGLHPVLLILSLLVFGYFFGLLGMLLAVPITALIIMSVKFFKEYKLTV